MSSKEIDSENTTWKGAAVMATLESSHELWIYAQEWKKYGVRLLREKYFKIMYKKLQRCGLFLL